MGALANLAWLGEPVDRFANRAFAQSAVLTAQQRPAVVVVGHFLAVVLQVVLEHTALVRSDGDRPLGCRAVLQCGLRVWAGSDIETLGVRGEVVDIECLDARQSNARMPQYRRDDVVTTCVRESVEVAEDRLRSVGREVFVARYVIRRYRWEIHTLSYPRFDGVNRRTERKEHAECLQLTPERDWLDVLVAPDSERWRSRPVKSFRSSISSFSQNASN